MNEAEWEAFLARADLRADRYGELLETLIDDPDRDAKIAHEMGWDDEDDDPLDRVASEVSESVDGDIAAAADIGDDPFGDDEDEDDDRAAVPAYAAASDLGHRVADLLAPLEKRASKAASASGESDDELIGRAFIGIQIAAAKLTGGHGMGYDDEAICGNIVCCRRALAGAVDGRRGRRPGGVAGRRGAGPAASRRRRRRGGRPRRGDPADRGVDRRAAQPRPLLSGCVRPARSTASAARSACPCSPAWRRSRSPPHRAGRGSSAWSCRRTG